MPTIQEIFENLNALAPVESKQPYDNVGLLVGHAQRQVTRILVALDVTGEVVSEAERIGAELIVSHHPVIFPALSTVTDEDYTGARVLALAEKGIAAICMHTNLDAALGGVGDALAAALGLEQVVVLPGTEGVVRAGTLASCTGFELAMKVKLTLDCNGVKYCDAGKPITKVAVGGGSCSEFIDAVAVGGCDAFVTADVKYSRYQEAEFAGITLVDGGHFNTEKVICPVLADRLKAAFPEVEVLETAVLSQPEQFA